MNHGNWKRGKPIPACYRNKMYAWEGGGYDGCFWEMNQGVVTDDGHWNPFHSTGRNGLDVEDEYLAKLRRLKERHGFEGGRYGAGENVHAWYSCLKHRAEQDALHKFYGEDWYNNPDYFSKEKGYVKKFDRECAEFVADRLKNETARYNAYLADFRELKQWETEEADELFMRQVKAQRERDPKLKPWDYHGEARDRWEVYPLDEDRIKKTCARFCSQYSGTVGVMCGVLDSLAELGYGVWCTCSDCGEQFQLWGYEKFSHLIDDGAYHGDGGIGCVFTRVLCEECHSACECPKCCDPNLPNPNDPRVKGHEYDRYTFRERFIAEWIHVCDSCAFNFFTEDAYKHWDSEIDDLEEKCDELDAELAEANAQLEKYLGAMKEKSTPERLEELRKRNLDDIAKRIAPGVESRRKELVNAMRDRMEKDVLAHYGDDVCNGNEKERL